MRIHELFESTGSDLFLRTLHELLQQRYPQSKFNVLTDRVESEDGLLTVIGGVEQEDHYVGVFLWDASTGPYTGVLTQAIKLTTEQLLRNNPDSRPALFLGGDNQNPSAWNHIANRLGYEIISDEDELYEASNNDLVYRIDNKPIKDFQSSLRSYLHTPDWSESGLDTGDNSYWDRRNIKPLRSKGLYAARDLLRVSLYATGNPGQTRYVEYLEKGRPVVYFDSNARNRIAKHRAWLTAFAANRFKKVSSWEYFSEDPGAPVSQSEITNPLEFIHKQGWTVRFTDDLDGVHAKVKSMNERGLIPHYGAEGFS